MPATESATQQMKKLLKICERKLSYSDDGSFVRTKYIRHPGVPLINVLWSSAVENAGQLVKDVFEATWMYGNSLESIVGFAEGGTNADELSSSVRKTVVSLLKSEGIADKTNFFFAHYLNILSPNYNEELEAACGLWGSFGDILSNTVDLFFVICDDSDATNQKKIRQLINSTEARIKNCNHAYGFYLGNCLSDGSLINSDETGENYRVAADIAMLLTTAPDEEHRVPQNIVPWLNDNSGKSFTAAYTKMQKPSGDIVRVTMESILSCRSKISKDNQKELNGKTAVSSPAMFWDSMGEKENQLTAVEQAFKDYVLPYLPKENAFEYLPNWKKASKDDNYSEANSITNGFLSLFVKEKFAEAVKEMEYIDYSEIENSFINGLLTHCDYDFIKESFEKCAEYIDFIKPQSKGGIYQKALYEARVQFYNLLRPRLKEAMVRQAQKARRFSEIMGECLRTVSTASLATATGLIPVDEFYSDKAGKQLSSQADKVRNTIAISDDTARVVAAVETMFNSIVACDSDLYRCPLEDELENRLKNKEKASDSLISVALDSETINNKQRVKATSYGENKLAFYIYYGDARFGDSLKDSGGKFVTGAKNSAERLIISSFSAENLIGG